MADVNANISVNIDTSAALAELKSLQRQIANFHNSIAKSSASAAIAQRNLQQGFVDSINATGQFAARMQTIRTSAESFTNSLEKNKFSMREYFRYGVASSKMFGKAFKTEFETINKVALERTRKLQTQYIKMGRDANGAMQAIAVTPLALDMENLATKTMMAAQKQQLFNQLLKQGSTNLVNFGKNTQWAGRQLMVGFTLPLSVFGSSASKVFMDLETEMIRFKRVYGDLFTLESETTANMKNIRGLAQEFTRYGVTVRDTLATAADAAAAGFSGAQLESAVRQSTRLAVLGEVDRQEAFKATIALQTAFKLNNNELADSINFLNAVENQSVVSLQNLTDAIPRTAPIIRGLGGDVKDLSVFLAAMQEGGVDAASAANGLKSALASIINPTKVAKEMLNSAGIDIKNIVDKNAGNLMRTVLELGDALKTLTPLARQKILEQLFGKFQFARVGALFENIAKEGSQAQRTMELMQMSAQDLAQLANKELAAIEESTSTKFKSAVEEIRAALAPVGELFLQIVTPVVKAITSLIEKFNNLSDNSKKVIGTIVAVLGGVAPVVLMLVGLFANFAGNLMKFFGLLRNGYLKLTGQSKYLGEQTQYLTEEQMQAEAVASSLDQVHARLTQRFTSEASALENLRLAYIQATDAARKFAINNSGMMLPQGPTRKYNKGISIVPGSGNRDTIPAMLTPGESVIPKKQTQKYGGLISGIIADNIPGFRTGVTGVGTGATVGTVLGGTFQQRRFSPLAMMAPGNTASGFGMDPEWLQLNEEAKASFASAIKTAAMAEAGITQTKKNYEQFWTGLNPVLDGIFDIFAQGITPDVTNIAQVGESQYPLMVQHIDALESNLAISADVANQLRNSLRKLVAPLESDLTQQDVRRAEIAVNDLGEAYVKRASYERSGQTLKPQVVRNFPRELEMRGLPAPQMSDYTFAHIPQADSREVTIPPYLRQKAGAGNSAERALIEQINSGAVIKEGYRIGVNLGQDTVNAVATGAGTASPSKKTIPIGEDIANGLIVGMNNRSNAVRNAAMRLTDEATTESGLIVPGSALNQGNQGTTTFLGMPTMPKKLSFGKRMRNKYSAVSDRMAGARASMQPMMGKLNAATMALTSVGLAASMVPGPLGEMAQKLMPAVMGIQGLAMALPMLMTPMGAAVGIIAAVGAGFYLVNKSQKDYIKSIKETADKEAKIRIGSADSIRSYSDYLGEGGTPSQRQFNRVGDTKFISAENAKLSKFREYYEGVGKDSANLIKFAATKGSAEALAATAQDIANRVSVFGLDPKDIAANIKAAAELAGVNEVSLKAKLQELLAPGGADILTTPLTVEARLKFLSKDLDLSLKNISAEVAKVTNAKPLNWLERNFAPEWRTKDKSKAFMADQTRQALISSQLDMGFKKQTEALAILNAQYVDGTINAEQYNAAHMAIMNNFAQLGDATNLYISKLKEIDSSGQLAKDAMSDLADQVLDPFVKANKKVGTEVKKIFNLLPTEIQTNVLINLSRGSLTPTDILQIDLLTKEMDGKTIDQKYQFIADIPQISQTLKLILKLQVAMEGLAKAGDAATRARYTFEIQNLQKELDALNKVTKDSPTLDGNKNVNDGGKGSDPYAFLEGLLSRLKQVRKESINAGGGVNYFVKLLKKDMTGFKGMDQMLRAAGATQGFIDIVNGLDSTQLKTFGKRLYQIKDGKIIFGDLGKAIQRFTKEVQLGEFNDQLQQSVVNADNQYKAYTKLRAAGLSASQALELTSDNALAAAIAAEKVDSQDFKNFIEGAKKGEKATLELAKALKAARFEAEQDQETQADKIDDFFAYQEASIKLEKYRQFVAKNGMSPADYERTKIKPLEKEIEAQQKVIDKVQEQIDAEQNLVDQYSRGIDLIGREEDKINAEYDKRIAVIDEEITALDKVQKINQEIVDQQKRSTSLADALSSGDIAAAAQIAQEMRGAAATSAIEQQKAALEERKNQLDLEITAKINALQVMIGKELYTRDQLEAMILEKEDAIYKLQNESLKTEQQKLKDKQEQLDIDNEVLKLYEEDLATALGNIKTESGLTKDEWNLIKDAVNATNDYFDTMITDLDSIATGTLSIASAWDAVTAAINAANAAKNAFAGSGNGGNNGGNNGDGSKVVLTTSDGKTFTADQVKQNIENLETMKNEIKSGSYAVFKLKEQIDELRYILDNPRTDKIIDEQTKIAGAKAALAASKPANKITGSGGGKYNMLFESRGGFIAPKYLASGGLARGSDKIPAMLTPGEFVMNKYAVSSYGLERMKAINSGTYNGDSMYNYNLTVNVKSDADANDIANTVMSQLRQIESKRLRGARL